MAALPAGLALTLQDRYRLDRELGQGGMATVYLAHDLKHHRDVALKVLRPELSFLMGPERFLAEIRTTAQLRHPHILPLFDSGEAAGLLYYVMPLVEGESLRECLRRENQLPLDRALAIATEIGSALDYAHKRGVIHRDLKPENILLAEGGALLADFGIALPTGAWAGERITGTGLSVGTPGYMSPEQAAGERVLGASSDVFSLGVVTYEMLAGEAPFTGPNGQAVILKVMIEQPLELTTRRPGLPSGVGAAVRWALAKEPADRPASAGEFVTALRSPAATPTAEGPPRSIAVLPFTNMSADPENEFFADGIAEEIINALARLPGLRVAARTSAFSFKGKNENLRSIGEKLRVASVLEGSVRRAGNRIRISAQLITVADGFHQWSERYDREIADVFAVQDEIASAIVERLRLSFNRQSGSLVQPGTESVEAYQLYLKGRALLYRRGPNIEKARECFEQARAVDPQYALAHAGLADALIYLAIWGVHRPAEMIPPAKIAAARALELDPELAEGHYATALIAYFHDYDAPTFTREFARAVELKPTYTQARCGRAMYDLCDYRADFDAAVAECAGAVHDDPLSAYAATIHAMILAEARRFPEAVVEARRASEMDPDSVVAWWHLACILGWSGDHAGAVRASQIALALFPHFNWAEATLAAEYGRVGDRAGAEQMYADMTARAATGYVQPTTLAIAAAGCGRLEEGMALLLQAVEQRDGWCLSFLLNRPELEPLRRLPGYREVLRQTGWTNADKLLHNARGPDAD